LCSPEDYDGKKKDGFRMLEFVCLNCKDFIVFERAESRCQGCGWAPTLVAGKPSWNQNSVEQTQNHDFLDSIKTAVKRFPRIYSFITVLISPVYPFAAAKDLRILLDKNSSGVMVNVGSGADRIHKNIINLDIQPFAQVDALVDAANLPLRSSSVDFVVSNYVMEHVRDPNTVAKEIVRIIKPGGMAYVTVPFIQGFHASPHDYQRYTLPGLTLLFKDLEVVRAVVVGPTSGLIWVMSEWLALLSSFGIARVQAVLATLFGMILSPIKYLDIILGVFPNSGNVSSAFTLIMRKRRD
jgi:SAM-dependent methyltransferase